MVSYSSTSEMQVGCVFHYMIYPSGEPDFSFQHITFLEDMMSSWICIALSVYDIILPYPIKEGLCLNLTTGNSIQHFLLYRQTNYNIRMLLSLCHIFAKYDPDTLSKRDSSLRIVFICFRICGHCSTCFYAYLQLQGPLDLAGILHTLVGMTGMDSVPLRFLGPVRIVPTILLIGIHVSRATLRFSEYHWDLSLS